jgi:hypothetical protein
MLTVVGDCHGLTDRYVNKVKDLEASVQLGDMAHNYSRLSGLDPLKHKFFGGNHDNYDIYYQQPHSLGDFGEYTLGGIKFFFMRGAFSIDRIYRTPKVDWWEEEELSYAQLNECITLYQRLKPAIVITHDCPLPIAEIIGNKRVLINYGFDPHTYRPRTQLALTQMFEIHQPELWLFGHFHLSREVVYKGTKFICLNELEIFEIGD